MRKKNVALLSGQSFMCQKTVYEIRAGLRGGLAAQLPGAPTYKRC
jgi:hypothetical protein